jgi:hypothetical protein
MMQTGNMTQLTNKQKGMLKKYSKMVKEHMKVSEDNKRKIELYEDEVNFILKMADAGIPLSAISEVRRKARE